MVQARDQVTKVRAELQQCKQAGLDKMQEVSKHTRLLTFTGIFKDTRARHEETSQPLLTVSELDQEKLRQKLEFYLSQKVQLEIDRDTGILPPPTSDSETASMLRAE